MKIDERSSEQKITHNMFITATDKFLSKMSGKTSKCAWACKPEHAQRVYEHVKNRGDMSFVYISKQYPKNASHLHIYVVGDGHRYLDGV